MSRDDLFHGHVGGIDTLALSLLVAADMIEDGTLEAVRRDRYSGWSTGIGIEIMDGSVNLPALEKRVAAGEIDPTPVSGRQEQLENLINRTLHRTV